MHITVTRTQTGLELTTGTTTQTIPAESTSLAEAIHAHDATVTDERIQNAVSDLACHHPGQRTAIFIVPDPVVSNEPQSNG